MVTVRVALVFALALVIGPAVARAQGAAAPAAAGPTSDEEAARAAFEKGTSAYALGDFAEAARQYEAAFRLKLDPALLYNAAQAHRRANNRPRAIELYENLLKLFPNAPNREVARQHLEELRKGPAGPGTAVAPAVTLVPPPVAAPVPSATPTVALEQNRGEPARPLYRRPWFWGAVAGVVLVGVVTAVAVAAGDDPAAKPSWGQVGQ